MKVAQILSLLAGILVVVALVPYIRAILAGYTRPSKASWIIWCFLTVVTTVGMHQAGSLNFQIAIIAIGDVVVLCLAFKYGTPGWKPVEKWSLVGGAAGVLWWAVTQNPLYGILISQVVNFAGSIPTFTKTWEDPASEDKTAWTIIAISSLLQTIASMMGPWTLEALAQPVTFLVLQVVMVFLIYVRPRRFITAA